MNEFAHIMMIEGEFFPGKEMFNIFQAAGDKIVHTDHFTAFFYKTVTQVRAKKARSSGD
jgi:hypothetical protein